MLHSFLSSRFYSFTIVGTVAFAVAAVLMMGFLHGRVQRTFLDAMRAHQLQGMTMLCLAGRDAVDNQLSLVRQELRDMAAAHGRRLREADTEQRRRILSGLRLHVAEAEGFFFQDERRYCLEGGGAVDPARIASAVDAAWSGHFALIGPYFDDAGRYRLRVLEPCFSQGAVIGVLGVQLDGALVSRWIRRLALQGTAGFSCIFDRNGFPVAVAADDGRSRIRAFYEAEAQELRGDDELKLLRTVRSAVLHKDVGVGGHVLEDGAVHLSYQMLAQAPWIFFVGFEEDALRRQVAGTAEKALQGSILYFVLLVSAILLIVGLTLFDALRNRRLSVLLAEQNATISRQAENLLASEKMFRYTLTQCSTQVIDYDLSSRMLTFYSGSQKDVVCVPEGEDWGALLLRDKDISPEAQEEIRALVHDVLSGAARESCDFRLRDKASGKAQWHRLSLSGVSGEDGAPRRLIGIIEDISEVKEAEYDLLTRLYNRKSSEEMIRHQLASRPSRQPYAFVLLDVDRFKSVNDTFGHPIGDKVLEDTAALLRATFREEDILGRLGGDEFCVFLSGEYLEKARLENALASLCRQAHAILKCPAGERPAVSFSCGAVFSCARHSFEELYMVADEALYRIKEGGRDNFEIVVWDGAEK